MATNWRGRGSSASRSGYGAYSYFGTKSGAKKWGKSGTSSKRHGTSTTGIGGSTPTGYRNVCNSLQRKMDSFKTLYNQAKGPARYTRPTPAILNSFCNWINKGSIVQTVSSAKVARWARLANKNFNSRSPTTASCKTVLCAKFGKTTIKAVARTKTGQFMVVTTPTWHGKSFKFPH